MPIRWMLALMFAALGSGSAAQTIGPAAPVGDVVTYDLKKGDTLYLLAAHWMVHGADAATLKRLNQINNPRRLAIGRKVSIPLDLLTSESIEARLTAYSGAVTVSGPGAGPLAREMVLREGYELSTGANAFLTLELADGSRTTLPSQSRVKIERLRRVLLTGGTLRDFRLIEGRSSSTVTPFKDPASRYRILTPLTVAAVRGTDFRVTHDAAAQRSTLEVIEGRVGDTATAADAAEIAVAAGFGAATTATGQSLALALAPRPKVNHAGRIQDEPQVTFAVVPSEGAAAYRAQVATDAGFIDILSETTAASPDLTFTGLADGSYFARFTVLDHSGLEGLPVTYSFQRRLIGLGLDKPERGAGAKPQYRFKWRSPDPTASYRFVLSHEPDEILPIVDQSGLSDHEIVITGLPKGAYAWRVQVIVRDHGKLIDKWSPAQRFEIAD